MSEKENFYAALLVIALGVCVHLIIPYEVSTEPIPGSRGFVTVSPSTLPRIAAWGLVIVGLIWAVRSFLHMRAGRDAGAAPPADELTALEHKRWLLSLMVWAGTAIYVALIPLLGYAEASILYGATLAFVMLWARPEGLKGIPWGGLGIGVLAFPVALYYVFQRFFYVTLEPGPLSGLLIGG